MRVFKKKVLLRNQPWMKKRRRRERSKDDNRSQTNHIPLDLTLDIVSRLPLKSIVRYRCVSKLWSSFITLPTFINSFTSRSTSRSPTLLVTISSGSEKYVFSFPQDHQIPDGSTCSSFYSYQITNLDWIYSRSDSIHGLILTPVFTIWNPTLRQFLALPHPDTCTSSQNRSDSLDWSSYLGYDPLEGKHKVLVMLRMKHTDQPRVLTLGGQESWRTITKGRCPTHHPTRGYGRCFNGILYYRVSRLGDSHDTIMSFDVKSEYFNSIHYPEGRSRSFTSFHMIHYEGRLALVAYDYPYDDVTLYILEDAHGHKWTRERFVLHLPYESVQKYSIHFRGTTDAGEIVFAPYDLCETFYVLYLDPRRKSTRKVFFERNLGDLRRRCGLDRTDKFTLEVFPNHIESLFSL